MDGDALQEQISMLQVKYTQLLTQAAQEGRTDDVQSITNQMQQEIQALVDAATQSATIGAVEATPAGNDESDEDEDWVEEDQDGDDEEPDDEDEDEEETEDEDIEE